MVQETVKKSLRLPIDLVEYVESCEGDDFSKKMVNILTESREGEQLRKKNIAEYNQEVEISRERLIEMNDSLQKAQRVLDSLRSFFFVAAGILEEDV